MRVPAASLFSANARKLQRAQGITKADLARALGLTPRALDGEFFGRDELTMARADRIARALGTTVGTLLANGREDACQCGDLALIETLLKSAGIEQDGADGVAAAINRAHRLARMAAAARAQTADMKAKLDAATDGAAGPPESWSHLVGGLRAEITALKRELRARYDETALGKQAAAARTELAAALERISRLEAEKKALAARNAEVEAVLRGDPC
ncbi:hypothetical protein GCM10022221_67720 [Actinocorallia aurea]